MKKYIVGFITFITLAVLSLTTAGSVHADQYVNGYFKSNGTYVEGYYRSSPDSDPTNNYSYPGNYNPYTGNTATGNADTYLNDYTKNGSSGSGMSGASSVSKDPIYGGPTCSVAVKYGCATESDYTNMVNQLGVLNSSSGQTSGIDLSNNSSLLQCRTQIVNYQNAVTTYNSCMSGWQNVANDQINNANDISSQNLVSICQNSLGGNSKYDSASNQCVCNTGYRLYGGTCTLNYVVCVSIMGPNSHSTASGCQCDDGYITNTGETRCSVANTADSVDSTSAQQEAKKQPGFFDSILEQESSVTKSAHVTPKISQATSTQDNNIELSKDISTNVASSSTIIIVNDRPSFFPAFMNLLRSLKFW